MRAAEKQHSSVTGASNLFWLGLAKLGFKSMRAALT
jgi:hypothetical protein